MKIGTWPFLVSRNRDLDYRTVVAPDFMCAAKASNLLARVAEGDLTEEGKLFFRPIYGTKAGDFAIVFQVLHATERCLNPQQKKDGVLKDTFGREIYLIEGLVIKGIDSKKDFSITDLEMDEVHSLLMNSYQQFWHYTEPQAAISSSQIKLTRNNAGLLLQLKEIDAFQVHATAQQKPTLDSIAQNEQQTSFEPSFPERKQPTKFIFNLVTIVVSLVLLLIISFVIVQVWSSSRAPKYACTVTYNDFIQLSNGENIGKSLSNWKQINHLGGDNQKNYPQPQVFLSGELSVEPLDEFKPLEKRMRPGENQYYTARINGDVLEMQNHPLDLAIIQLADEKIIGSATISAEITVQKDCQD